MKLLVLFIEPSPVLCVLVFDRHSPPHLLDIFGETADVIVIGCHLKDTCMGLAFKFEFVEFLVLTHYSYVLPMLAK